MQYILMQKTDDDLQQYKGKLKGAIVLTSEPRELKAHFTPDADRLTDEDLLKLATPICRGAAAESEGGTPPAFRMLRERAARRERGWNFASRKVHRLSSKRHKETTERCSFKVQRCPQPLNSPMDRRINPYDEVPQKFPFKLSSRRKLTIAWSG